MSSIAAVLPQDLTAFLKDHPRVRIDLSEQTSRDIQSLVADGQADIGILTSAHFREELLANPYYMDEVVAIVPAKGRWLKTKSIAMDDFFSQDLIILQEGGAIAEWLGDLARSRGTVLRVRVRAKGFDALAQLVAAGLGITALPRRVAERFSKLLRLRILALPEVETQRTISVCRPRLGHRVAAASDLFDFLSLRHTRRQGRK
jgi:DNA-binding transcriptional LysR family regulator